jgi:hypothetical protein
VDATIHLSIEWGAMKHRDHFVGLSAGIPRAYVSGVITQIDEMRVERLLSFMLNYPEA